MKIFSKQTEVHRGSEFFSEREGHTATHRKCDRPRASSHSRRSCCWAGRRVAAPRSTSFSRRRRAVAPATRSTPHPPLRARPPRLRRARRRARVAAADDEVPSHPPPTRVAGWTPRGEPRGVRRQRHRRTRHRRRGRRRRTRGQRPRRVRPAPAARDGGALLGDDGDAESQFVDTLAAWEDAPAAASPAAGAARRRRAADPACAAYARPDAATRSPWRARRTRRRARLRRGQRRPRRRRRRRLRRARGHPAVGSVATICGARLLERGALDLVAPSSGGARITTTDLDHGGALRRQRDRHLGGTSAAAPSRRRPPPWCRRATRPRRARRARPPRRDRAASTPPTSWTVNAAGVAHSDWYRHGLLDAAAAVALAPGWTRLPPAERVARPHAGRSRGR